MGGGLSSGEPGGSRSGLSFGRFGVPLILYSDQGQNFESAVSSEICKLRVTKPGPLPSTHSLTVWWNALSVPLRLNSQNLLRITTKTGISRNLSQGCYSCCDSLLPFLEAAYPDGHQHMEDNDPKHTSRYPQWWYENNEIN